MKIVTNPGILFVEITNSKLKKDENAEQNESARFSIQLFVLLFLVITANALILFHLLITCSPSLMIFKKASLKFSLVISKLLRCLTEALVLQLDYSPILVFY